MEEAESATSAGKLVSRLQRRCENWLGDGDYGVGMVAVTSLEQALCPALLRALTA